MTSSGGITSSGTTTTTTSSQNQTSSSEEEMQIQIIDERKRKRMISNRESARRSRQRKQKHLDDLTAQVANLRRSNHQILNTINVTTQHFMKVEAENSVLRAQMLELSNRLQSLNQINEVLASTSNDNNHNNNNTNNNNDYLGIYGDQMFPFTDDTNPWNSVAAACMMNQPIMAASAHDMFQY